MVSALPSAFLSVLMLASTAAFEFISVGDWGDTGAKTIAPDMAKHSPEFIFGIGDNFYNKGVKSVDDPQFKSKFEDTFTGPSLQVPWYICAGKMNLFPTNRHPALGLVYQGTCREGRVPWYQPFRGCSPPTATPL